MVSQQLFFFLALPSSCKSSGRMLPTSCLCLPGLPERFCLADQVLLLLQELLSYRSTPAAAAPNSVLWRSCMPPPEFWAHAHHKCLHFRKANCICSTEPQQPLPKASLAQPYAARHSMMQHSTAQHSTAMLVWDTRRAAEQVCLSCMPQYSTAQPRDQLTNAMLSQPSLESGEFCVLGNSATIVSGTRLLR